MLIPTDWYPFIVSAFGLILGSAVTALSHRIPRDQSWVHGRSGCPQCGATLGVRDLIPVLSYVLSRGRCRHCGAHIGVRYPITELLCAAWAFLLYRHIGLGFDYPFLLVWGVLMIALMWIDLDFQILPDVLTFPGTLIGLAAALQWHDGARHAIGGVLMGSGLLAVLAWGYQAVRKVEGLGGGDVKLAAMFGVVLGLKLSLLTLFLAALIGSLWGGYLILRRQGSGQTALPFGTLLAPAALVAFLYGDRWVGSYLTLFPRP